MGRNLNGRTREFRFRRGVGMCPAVELKSHWTPGLSRAVAPHAGRRNTIGLPVWKR
jgi:hypothetical protein